MAKRPSVIDLRRGRITEKVRANDDFIQISAFRYNNEGKVYYAHYNNLNYFSGRRDHSCRSIPEQDSEECRPLEIGYFPTHPCTRMRGIFSHVSNSFNVLANENAVLTIKS